MKQIVTRFDNDDHYVGGNTKQYLVIHDTGNFTDSASGNANYFCTGARDSSAHYFVDDNFIYQIVADNDCSWHCGDGNGAYGITNTNSIGIEMCRVNGTVTATTEANTIELIISLMTKYNIPIERVVRHYDASRKVCPSSFADNNWSRWTAFKVKIVKLKEEGEVKYPFCVKYYLEKNPDVAKAGVDPYTHYVNCGIREGRKGVPPTPSDWNEAYYLINNPDVNIAVSKGWCPNGLTHYQQNGWYEGRKWSQPDFAKINKALVDQEVDVELDKKVAEIKAKIESILK